MAHLQLPCERSSPHLVTPSNPYFASLVDDTWTRLANSDTTHTVVGVPALFAAIRRSRIISETRRVRVADVVTSKLNARVEVERLWQQLDNSHSNTPS